MHSFDGQKKWALHCVNSKFGAHLRTNFSRNNSWETTKLPKKSFVPKRNTRTLDPEVSFPKHNTWTLDPKVSFPK